MALLTNPLDRNAPRMLQPRQHQQPRAPFNPIAILHPWQPNHCAIVQVQGGGGRCELSVGGTQLTFQACTPIQGVGSNYHLFWTVVGRPPGSSSGSSSSSSSGGSGGASGSVPAGKTLVKFGMNATSDGWVAVGFPATPAHMIGSTALVLRVCTAYSSGSKGMQRLPLKPSGGSGILALCACVAVGSCLLCCCCLVVSSICGGLTQDAGGGALSGPSQPI